ncbi:hypothetical protein E2562_021592 [Oryza meyeriana var. granulata]|uniref:Uncharacterized protein n=1 Tax=Oryza meyeriana var. granulata TaxID=110450 RepID=A0A6G1EC18_9ORYZ|nr:hypothetical protein E2562_021592 [Oryza meyeriana var. granulata]
MVQKSRGWSGFISEVLEVVLKVSAVFNLWEVTSGSSCESNVGVVLISTLSTALRQNCDVSGSRQNRPAGKSNARGKGDLIPSIDRPARLVSPVVDAVVGGGGPEQVAAMVQKSRGWSGFISKVLEVILKVSAVFNLWEVTSGSSCESNVGVVLISTLSTALRL